MRYANEAVEKRQISKVCPEDAGHLLSPFGSPFYLMCGPMPLPLAVEMGIHPALEWRDKWSALATPEAKRFCNFDGKNWRAGTPTRISRPG